MSGTATCRLCGHEATIDPKYRSVALRRCSSCGFLFAPDRQEADLRPLYDEEYFESYSGGEAYDEDEAQRRYEARCRVTLLRRFCTGGRLLEIGAAAGYFLREASESGFDVVGIEPVAGVAERARERLGIDIRLGFIEDVALPDASFDAACAWHVVEHLSDPVAAIGHVRRALRPGAFLLLEVPNVESVYARRLLEAWPALEPDYHVGHYGPSSLGTLLERAGFEIQATETFPALGYVRPGLALRPDWIAVQAKELVQVRALPRRSHPSKHEMLRAIARVPSTA